MNANMTKQRAMPIGVGRTLYLIGVVILSFNCHVAGAGPLDLDETFNGTGKVVTSVQPLAQEYGTAVAIQQGGKIVAVGSTVPNTKTDWDFALVRYKADGSIDQAFGTNGRVITSTHDRAAGVVIQPADQKIVVAGTVCNLPYRCTFALARYHPSGDPDEGFGTMGLERDDLEAWDYRAHGVALQQDGKIVIAGEQQEGGNQKFLIARYLPNGARRVLRPATNACTGVFQITPTDQYNFDRQSLDGTS